MKLDSVPSGFSPYNQLECAGNKLIGGTAFFSFRDNIPLLIGKASTPEVWISIPVNLTGEEWRPLVRKNRSLHPDVHVVVLDKKVVVNTPDGVVLEVLSKGGGKAEITKLDFRPFGLSLFLERGSLNVMTNKLSGNTIAGSKIAIGIG